MGLGADTGWGHFFLTEAANHAIISALTQHRPDLGLHNPGRCILRRRAPLTTNEEVYRTSSHVHMDAHSEQRWSR